ncbi:MAG: hypothetical protein WC356_06260 [Candidatus Micrarchaeia archaeon]|jgi:mRNA-degrading endonuclease RelE of RelBE toxin-antitoxin system
MAFEFDLSEELKEILYVLNNRDKKLAERINKKIKEIINCDLNSVNHYQNLKYEFKDRKRVHIGHFVLTFKIYKEKNFILFINFSHHDEIYILK